MGASSWTPDSSRNARIDCCRIAVCTISGNTLLVSFCVTSPIVNSCDSRRFQP